MHFQRPPELHRHAAAPPPPQVLRRQQRLRQADQQDRRRPAGRQGARRDTQNDRGVTQKNNSLLKGRPEQNYIYEDRESVIFIIIYVYHC